jgi:methyl-accepting chemotaxis protein
MPSSTFSPEGNIHAQLENISNRLEDLAYSPNTSIQFSNELKKRIDQIDAISFEIFKRQVQADTAKIDSISEGIEAAANSLDAAVDRIEQTAQTLQNIANVLDIVDKVLVLAAGVVH